MGKRVIAVVKIIHDGKEIMPGDEIDRDTFDKDKLTHLYERGVIKIEDTPDARPKRVEESSTVKTSTHTPVNTGMSPPKE